MPHRVHAPMDAMQTLLLEPLGNRPSSESQLHQLATSDHPMLTLRELGDRLVVAAPVPRPNAFSCTYAMHNFRFAGHGPIVAASV